MLSLIELCPLAVLSGRLVDVKDAGWPETQMHSIRSESFEKQILTLKCQTGPPTLPLYKKLCIIKVSILFIRVAIPKCMLNLYLNLVYLEHKTKGIAATKL